MYSFICRYTCPPAEACTLPEPWPPAPVPTAVAATTARKGK